MAIGISAMVLSWLLLTTPSTSVAPASTMGTAMNIERTASERNDLWRVMKPCAEAEAYNVQVDSNNSAPCSSFLWFVSIGQVAVACEVINYTDWPSRDYSSVFVRLLLGAGVLEEDEAHPFGNLSLLNPSGHLMEITFSVSEDVNPGYSEVTLTRAGANGVRYMSPEEYDAGLSIVRLVIEGLIWFVCAGVGSLMDYLEIPLEAAEAGFSIWFHNCIEDIKADWNSELHWPAVGTETQNGMVYIDLEWRVRDDAPLRPVWDSSMQTVEDWAYHQVQLRVGATFDGNLGMTEVSTTVTLRLAGDPCAPQIRIASPTEGQTFTTIENSPIGVTVKLTGPFRDPYEPEWNVDNVKIYCNGISYDALYNPDEDTYGYTFALCPGSQTSPVREYHIQASGNNRFRTTYTAMRHVYCNNTNTAPKLAIACPLDGDLYRWGNYYMPLNVRVNAADNETQITKLQISCNGVWYDAALCYGTSSNGIWIKGLSLATGTTPIRYDIKAVAYDTAGFCTTTPTISVFVVRSTGYGPIPN